MTYVLFGICSTVLLAHESGHVWKYKWMKVPVGILSIVYIYYCLFDFIWLLIAALFHLPSEASAYGTVAMLVLSSVTVAVGFLNTKKLRLTSYRLSFGNSGSVYRIALISDLHLGAFVGADHIRKIVATINSVHPDLVIIAGDLIDDDNSILSDREELDRVSGEFCKLQSAHGIILTLGNHDPEATDAEFLKFLERSQITLLHNKHLELPSINVIGRTDPTRNYREPLDRLMLGVNRSKPTVAVDHDPQYIDELAAQAIELVLAGHTHGGQFFPATIATHFAYGRNKYYGCHKIKHTHAIISSGAGFFNLPVRIATRNEVVDLILDV